MTEQLAETFAPGAILDGRYRLGSIIGSGGMGTVWRAVDQVLGRPVAVKVMSDPLAADPASVERFAHEARTAGRIVHANLVQIYDYSSRGRPYLIMELVEGCTLRDRLRRGAMRSSEVRELACDLLSALACVHRAGILHRDVKPANVLCGDDGRTRLTDFGVARRCDGPDLTSPGHTVGTRGYLAPELLGGAPPSPQSDLYSLGVLLREIPLADAGDPVLNYLVARLTLPRPEQRPRGAEAALRQLRVAAEASGPPTEPFDALPAAAAGMRQPRRTARRMARALGMAATAAVLAVALVLGLDTDSTKEARASRVPSSRTHGIGVPSSHTDRPGAPSRHTQGAGAPAAVVTLSAPQQP